MRHSLVTAVLGFAGLVAGTLALAQSLAEPGPETEKLSIEECLGARAFPNNDASRLSLADQLRNCSARLVRNPALTRGPKHDAGPTSSCES